ncbi:MAG: hypothetical protein JSS83_16125 [Cyanobacteria bacterium SZAS LIN-3]|nr:hypothetical protein [Cyanobacteria bacterium SZAS LIN-3]
MSLDTENSFAGEREHFIVVSELWDGPVTGVVFYRGYPHIFRRQFDDVNDELLDVYCLSPLAEDLLPIAEEVYSLAQRARKSESDVTEIEQARFLELRSKLVDLEVAADHTLNKPFKLHLPEYVKRRSFRPVVDEWEIEWLPESADE